MPQRRNQRRRYSDSSSSSSDSSSSDSDSSSSDDSSSSSDSDSSDSCRRAIRSGGSNTRRKAAPTTTRRKPATRTATRTQRSKPAPRTTTRRKVPSSAPAQRKSPTRRVGATSRSAASPTRRTTATSRTTTRGGTSSGSGSSTIQRSPAVKNQAAVVTVVKENGLIDKEIMDGLRKEILNFWKNVDVKSPSYLKFLAKDAAKIVKERALEKAQENGLDEGVQKWAKDIVYKMTEKLSETFGSLGVSLSPTFLKDIIKQFAGVVLSNVLNFAGPVKDVLVKLKNVTQKVIAEIVRWRKSALVMIGDGHPKVLCQSIYSAITKSLLSDIGGLVQSSVRLAGVVSSWGLTEFVAGFIDAISALGKFIWRCLERKMIQKFIKNCAIQYDRGLYRDKEGFANFLKGTTQYVPFVSAVTLHTGRTIVGEMGYFFMFVSPDGNKMNQQNFNETVQYIDKARVAARQLIEESKLELITENRSVQKVLDNNVYDDNFHVGFLHHIDVPKGSTFKKKKRGFFF